MTYFFHIGSDKTGTTIIARLIDQHPKIACMSESFFLLHGHKASVFNPGIITPRHGFDIDRRKVWSDYIDMTHDYKFPMIDALEDFKERCGKELVGDSWVRYITFIEKMVDMFPDAKYIYNVRDPRAVWLSGQLFKNKGIGDNQLRAMLIRERVIEKFKDKLDILTVKYEDVILNPRGMMTAIFDFLGHDFKDEYLDYIPKNDPYPLRWGQINNIRGSLDVSRIDRWRSGVHPKKIKEIERKSKWFMERYSYE